MAEIIDYGRFAERLAQDRPRWELLDEVQREWGYEDPGGDPQVTREDEEPEDELDESRPVPAAFVEWWDSPVNSYAFRSDLYETYAQWPPCEPDSGENPPGDEIRVIMIENQYVNQWGYLASEEHLPDPKVVVDTSDGWVTQSRSISEFFLQLALQRLPAQFGWILEVGHSVVDGDPGIVQRLLASYRDLGLLPWQELSVDSLTYGAPDALIRHNRGPNADSAIVIQGRTREAVVRVADTLNVTWTDEEIEEPNEVPLPVEDLAPAAFTEGGTDDRLRWTAVSTTATPPAPAVPDVPGLHALPDRTAVAADQEATTAVAGDSTGGVHVWAADGPRTRALHRAPVTAVTCHRSGDGGRTVVSGDAHGVLRYWPIGRAPKWAAFDRRRSPVVALTSECLETGPALAAAWADGLTRVWDLDTMDVADLPIGTGVTALTLTSDGVLYVTTGQGTAALRLDLDRLWPTRGLRLRLQEIDWGSLRAARGPADEVPGLIAKVASDDEETARAAVKRLYELLVSKRHPLSAAAPAVPFLVERMLVPANRARGPLLFLIADLAGGPGEERQAVTAAVPSLLHLRDDKNPSVKRAAKQLVRVCGMPKTKPDGAATRTS
ncbi:WD40 repeat domain-containing protein [Actinomadura roseirufa]|uniref:WD40 repeat domain-containing protein n=1 Tax=Actinomadura roseirufa TaxID=2094049 RepID=UPI00104115D0|nr:hypothetical protein [Actinomadura roseirufa]